MLAYVYGQDKKLTLYEVPPPLLQPGTAIARIEATSICGTDLRTYRFGSEKIKPPRITGHELCGTLIEVDPTIDGDFRVGDRVTVAPAIGCGACQDCEDGHPNMCVAMKTIGFNYDGAFSEYMLIPAEAFSRGNVNHVPDSLSDEEAALAEPVACCVNAQEYLNIRENDSVLIFGAGFIGCIHGELAFNKGARQVIMTDLLDARLQKAKDLVGNVEILNTGGSTDLSLSVSDLTRGRGPDVVIVACSSGKAQIMAIDLAARRGKVSLFGGLPQPSHGFIDSNAIHYKELCIYGAHASTPQQNRMILECLQQGKIDLKKYISGVFALREIDRAFSSFEDHDWLKIVLKA